MSYFASYSATVVHALLFNYRNIIEALKNTFLGRREQQAADVHYRLISVYPEVPQLYSDYLNIVAHVSCRWYITMFVASLVMAFVALTVYVPEAPKWVPSL